MNEPLQIHEQLEAVYGMKLGTVQGLIHHTIPVQVQILNELADVPAAARAGDAGFDLRSMVDTELGVGQRTLIPTGLSVAIPEGFAGFVLPRSGLAIRKGLSIVNAPGLIDSGFRGEVHVPLINLGFDWSGVEPFSRSKTIHIETGDRIAQLVILPIPSVEFHAVDDLPESERGDGGFGSTGA